MFASKSIKQATLLVKGARRLLAYRRDLCKPELVAEVEARIAALSEAIREKNPTDEDCKKLEKLCLTIAPPRPYAAWRENVEVVLVALVLAVGIRAYFLQPFKIPTGSMQPTLNGIIGYPTADEQPALPRRIFDRVILGRTWMNVVTPVDDRVVSIEPRVQNLFITRTEIVMEKGSYTVKVPPETLRNYFGLFSGREFKAGAAIAKGYVDTGDQVFVDKFSYNFVLPKRGDVFVFKTTGIERIERNLDPTMGSQFYIKRLAGMPGDLLQINPPELLVDGEKASAFGLARVMSMENGYRGYSNTSSAGAHFPLLGSPTATYQVPDDGYFALGDNSFNSSDSRDWGHVPEMNLVGRGFAVYWPFFRHWGLIR